MAIDTVTPRSRRALLAATLGGLAATVAAALGRPDRVSGSNGDALLIGTEPAAPLDGTGVNEALNRTKLYSPAFHTLIAENGHPNGTALLGDASGNGVNIGVNGGASGGAGKGVLGTASAPSGDTVGVEGRSFSPTGTGVLGTVNQGPSSHGVQGTATAGRGVEGTSESNVGVVGSSGTYIGVYGYSFGSLPGLVGEAASGATGVLGFSGGDLPAVPAKTGVYGHATEDALSRGVHGKSSSGIGVFGEAPTGRGVRGYSGSGVGLSGGTSSGYALRTDGRIRFDKSGGIATINAGASSVTVIPGIDLTATTVVVATLQGNAGGTTAVERVAINTVANTFQIILTGNTAGAVKVGWLVFG